MLNQDALDTLFNNARSHNGWLDRPVSDDQLKQIFELLKWAPTAFNSGPARIVFVKSAEQRARLAGCVAPTNAPKTVQAPVTAIIGTDMAFFEKLPQLTPHFDARGWFLANPGTIEPTAFRNASLQGAYLMLAARAIGLDCGPMSGFDADKVNAAFFADSTIKVNFICSLGYGDAAQLRPRAPRLAFDEACRIV